MTNEEAIKIIDKGVDIGNQMPFLTVDQMNEAKQMAIKALEQQNRIILCKDCKYFEYDHADNVDGIPLILAHEICNRWGDGCKTNINGWCFLAETTEEHS